MAIRKPVIGLAAAAVCATVFSAPASARPAAPAAGCAELGGTVQADQTCHSQTKTTTYSIEISYPLDYSDQPALTDFVKKDRDEFVDFTAAHPPRGRPYEHDLGSRMYRSGTASGTESVVFEIYDDGGGAHPVTGFQSFIYDVRAHHLITFDTLFKPGIDPVAVLDPIVQREKNAGRVTAAPRHTTLSGQGRIRVLRSPTTQSSSTSRRACGWLKSPAHRRSQ